MSNVSATATTTATIYSTYLGRRRSLEVQLTRGLPRGRSRVRAPESRHSLSHTSWDRCLPFGKAVAGPVWSRQIAAY
jgi:hypothetical protein